MSHALNLAEQAAANEEVPVGAVLIKNEQLIGEGSNAPIGSTDATAHAEIKTIRAACERVGNYRLPGTTLYLTLEPCAMCAGAIVHARIERVVIAAAEPRAGAAGSVFNVLESPQLNHRCRVDWGLGEDRSRKLLQDFFRARR
ncbi:MAG: nucleoside deaminase [Gammaproteobacteria bacterium]|nr:nucleoside deaminase [Gammaproteobacteria bacterium]